MDAVGQDAIPHSAAGFQQVFQVPVQLGYVFWVRYATTQDVRFELDARVVDVEVHATRVSDSRVAFRSSSLTPTLLWPFP